MAAKTKDDVQETAPAENAEASAPAEGNDASVTAALKAKIDALEAELRSSRAENTSRKLMLSPSSGGFRVKQSKKGTYVVAITASDEKDEE